MTDYTQPQPPPKSSDSPAVWPLVVRHARLRLRLRDATCPPECPNLLGLLVTDMERRDADGQRKYGVPLQVGNGRDHLVDAYQAALDLCVYLQAEDLRARCAEGTADDTDLRAALDLAFRLRLRLWRRDFR